MAAFTRTGTGSGAGFRNPSVYCADLLRLITHVRDRVIADVRQLNVLHIWLDLRGQPRPFAAARASGCSRVSVAAYFRSTSASRCSASAWFPAAASSTARLVSCHQRVRVIVAE